MQGPPKAHTTGARAVTTNQSDIYDKLEEVVRKYASTEYLRPIADHTRIAFTEAEKFVLNFYEQKIPAGACPEPVERTGMTNQGTGGNEGGAVRSTYKVILDSGCGTGESTLNIAIANPGIPVIGIDKSAARLTKAGAGVNGAGLNGAAPRNAFLVRAELLDFWRLALGKVKAGQWHIPYHALYYPNPWPKQSEATRRFHLHPIFPTLLQLGDTLELRTNWELYAREFAEAARVLREIPGHPRQARTGAGDDNTGTIAREPFEPERPITAFERKYKEARQQLWRVTINHV